MKDENLQHFGKNTQKYFRKEKKVDGEGASAAATNMPSDAESDNQVLLDSFWTQDLVWFFLDVVTFQLFLPLLAWLIFLI